MADPPAAGAENCLCGTITEIGYLGGQSLYQVQLVDGSRVMAAAANNGGERTRGVGDNVWLSFSPEAAIVLTR
jgi:ABC-type Fe3+/spermidine/putrescine transport system ATPase subunit